MAFDDDEDVGTTDHARTARGCIVEAAWAAAVNGDVARILALPGQKVAVVTVPDPTWVKPVERRIRDLLGDGWTAIAREAPPRSRDRLDPGNGELVQCLDNGKNVAGVAPSAKMLPGALIAAADLTIVVARPDANVVGEAIRRFLNKGKAPAISVGAGSLDLYELAATFRTGTAQAIVARIERANVAGSAGSGEDVPRLEDAIEYGEARTWGLTVAKDMKEFLDKRLPWSQVEHSIILHGPPGLGKTTLASSLARHMEGATLVQTSVSELFASSAGYLDSIIKALRDTYQRAEAKIPAVIIWDEIDALPSRVGLDSRSASWWSSVITDFMLMVSTVRPGIVQIACTNFVDKIDPALRRPGRFGRAIELRPPGPEGVVSILRFHLHGELAGADLSEFGELAAGSTAAEIMATVRRARALARADDRGLRATDLLDAAVEPAEFGPADLRRIAVHEAGHAVVSLSLDTDELTSLCIGGGGLGATKHRRRGELETRASIEDRVTMMLAGRAAEVVLIGAISSGSNSDLTGATDQMLTVHAKLGLGGTLSAFDETDTRRGWLDQELRAIIEKDLHRLQDRAVAIVRAHRCAVEAMARALAERRYLTGAAARRIFAANPPSAPAASLRKNKDPGC